MIVSPDNSTRRVRFHSVRSETTPDSKCRIRVEVEWGHGSFVPGESEGTATREGRLIAGAAATLQAIEKVTQGILKLEFRGAKVVRAFDTFVIIVALRGNALGRRYDLIGACEAPDDDVVRGVVLAVLDATNRVLEICARAEGEQGQPTDTDTPTPS
jgi:hypothetical protein